MRVKTMAAVLVGLAAGLSGGCGGGSVLSGIVPEIPDLGPKLAELIINENKTLDATPADFGYTYTDFSVQSANGATLRGWFIPAVGGSTRTVIFHHGNNSSRSAYIVGAEVFVEHGYNLVLYDYQGFGDSEGTSDFQTLLDDGLAVHAWAVANLGGEFVSMGASLGGPTAMHCAKNAASVRALVLDSPLVVAELALHYLNEASGLSFDASFEPTAVALVLAQFPAAYDLVGEAPGVGVPAQVVQGLADVVTPPDGAQAVYDALGVVKDLWLSPSEHGATIKDYPDEYVSRVVSFLDAAFAG